MVPFFVRCLRMNAHSRKESFCTVIFDRPDGLEMWMPGREVILHSEIVRQLFTDSADLPVPSVVFLRSYSSLSHHLVVAINPELIRIYQISELLSSH